MCHHSRRVNLWRRWFGWSHSNVNTVTIGFLPVAYVRQGLRTRSTAANTSASQSSFAYPFREGKSEARVS